MNNVIVNPLAKMVEDSESLVDSLDFASQELSRCIEMERTAREKRDQAKQVYCEMETESVAEAAMMANAGDDASPLYKVAATSKAWSKIADYLPIKCRKEIPEMGQACRRLQITIRPLHC